MLIFIYFCVTRLTVDDGECFGEARDCSSLYDDTVIILSQDQLRQVIFTCRSDLLAFLLSITLLCV